MSLKSVSDKFNFEQTTLVELLLLKRNTHLTVNSSVSTIASSSAFCSRDLYLFLLAIWDISSINEFLISSHTVSSIVGRLKYVNKRFLSSFSLSFSVNRSL